MAEIASLSTTDASNTARFPEGQNPSTVNDGARALEGLIARWNKDTDGSLASTGSANAYVVAANQTLSAYYDGLTVTFQANFGNTGAATLNVDAVGAQAIVWPNGTALSSGDIPSGAKVTVRYETANTRWQLVTVPVRPTLAGIEQGLHTIWVPAAAMKPTVSNGCAALTSVETTSGRPDMNVLDFDDAADEHAQFDIAFPKSWNKGTITFRVHHTTTATDTDGVAWGLQGVAMGDGDTIDAAYGTAVVVTDTYQSTAEDEYVTAVSSAVTIAGSPGNAERCSFRIFRDVSDAADTATEDARLLGVAIFFTIDAATDA